MQPLRHPTLYVLSWHVDDHAVAQSVAHRRYQVFMEDGVLLIPDQLALVGRRQVGVAQDDRCPEPHLLPGRRIGSLSRGSALGPGHWLWGS